MTTTVLARSATFGRNNAHTYATNNTIQVIRPAEVERRRYEEYLALPTAMLRQRAAEEIRGELALPSDRQREAIHTRLSAWLEMDPEDARIIARVWDEAASELLSDEARRRFEAECDAMLHGFAFEDFTQLARIMPWVGSQFGLAVFAATAADAA